MAGEVSEHPVAVFQRVDQAGYRLPIDERILADTDTLMVFGLDHLPSGQRAGTEESDAIRAWLEREGTCLLIAPHHDVGFTEDVEQRKIEYAHHRDPLVPRQQRFGEYTRSLMKALDVPVHNEFGLRPAVVDGTRDIAPLRANRDLDKLGLLSRLLHSTSTRIYRTTPSRVPTTRRFTCSPANQWISSGRIPSPRQAIKS